MNKDITDPGEGSRLQRHESLWLLPAGLLAMLPLLVLKREFGQLFWFGDEWDLIDLIDRMGFWKWTWMVFAENFVPLFKIMWGGCLHLFGGSYWAMLLILWSTHALNTILMGRVMRTCRFDWPAIWLAQVIFALTPINVETLGWSVQWSAVLAPTFMLLALDLHVRRQPHLAPFSLKTHLAFFALSLASALCFSRGILTGVLIAIASLWPAENFKATLKSRLIYAGVVLLPALLAAAAIILFSSGNHQGLSGHVHEVVSYAGKYFALNPLYWLLRMDSWGSHTITALAGLKLAIIIHALRKSHGPQRLLLLLLLAFDLANSALIGIGRYHTEALAVVSSRYQYGSLLVFLPMLGVCFEQALRNLPSILRSRAAVVLVLLCLAWKTARGWPAEIRAFIPYRGTENRQLLLGEGQTADSTVPGTPYMTSPRAKELIKKYNLH
jgi:hypothetical protein